MNEKRFARVATNLLGLQRAAKEIARQMTSAPTSDENQRGRELLHAVILSRTTDIETCGKCGGITNIPRPAFYSDEKWCNCVPLSGERNP